MNDDDLLAICDRLNDVAVAIVDGGDRETLAARVWGIIDDLLPPAAHAHQETP